MLDCIASGAVWVDMRACEVDVLISAPQKGWSSQPGVAIVMFSERAEAALEISSMRRKDRQKAIESGMTTAQQRQTAQVNTASITPCIDNRACHPDV